MSGNPRRLSRSAGERWRHARTSNRRGGCGALLRGTGGRRSTTSWTAPFRSRAASGSNRRAVGWDLARSPANLALSAPHLAARVSAGLARHAGLTPAADWLDSRRYFLQTDVARELEWRLFTELLELPIRQGERVSERDALAEEILRDPRIAPDSEDALQSPAEQEAFRAWLAGTVSTYEGTRVSAADLTTAAVSASVGALAFKKLTPGMLSLGPATAQMLVQHAAIAGFPLGSGGRGALVRRLPCRGAGRAQYRPHRRPLGRRCGDRRVLGRGHRPDPAWAGPAPAPPQAPDRLPGTRADRAGRQPLHRARPLRRAPPST